MRTLNTDEWALILSFFNPAELQAMQADGAREPAALRVDGGMVGNQWLMQFLADMLEVPVERTEIAETTALGAAYLAWLGAKMLLAKPGDAPVLTMKTGHYFRQTLLITLLNPKAIVFYLAFFPLFIDPVRQQGLLTFGFLALTIAVLAFLYGVVATLLTHFFAERMRRNPKAGFLLEKLAGFCLIGFGVRLVLTQ
jgi:arginine exporter protein ArgO